MASSGSLDLDDYDGDFSTLFTQGGIPTGDLSLTGSVNNSANIPTIEVDASNASFRQTDCPWQVIYGRTMVGGQLSLLTTESGLSGNFLHLVVSIAGHEIDGVEELWLDGRKVSFAVDNVAYGWATGDFLNDVFCSPSLGSPDQLANADLLGQANALFPTLWNEYHRGRGIAYVYLILKGDPSQFPNSMPTIQFVVRGKKVYDPRSGVTAWSQNNVLCTADMFCDPDFGMKKSYATDFNLDNLKEAADICDQDVDLAAGGTEKRYQLNGSFWTDAVREDVINSMRSGMAFGSILRIGGLIHFFPKTWRAPSLSIGPDDIVGGISLTTAVARADSFNTVTSKFVDPTQAWATVDAPVVTNATYVAQDQGYTNTNDVQYPFSTSGASTQRCSKILLEEVRQGMQVDLVCKVIALQCIVEDVVLLTWDYFGFVDKAFVIQATAYGFDDVGAVAVTLTLRETAEGIFDWNSGMETTVDLAPNSFLPDPTLVVAPTGLVQASGTDELLELGDGTQVTRVLLTWDNTDVYVEQGGRFEIQYKLSTDSVWTSVPSVPGSTNAVYIIGPQDGNEYDFRVRGSNARGYVSDYDTIMAQEVFGKLELPSDVTDFNASLIDYGITLTWAKSADKDVNRYEIRYGGTTWTDSPTLAVVDSTTYRLEIHTSGTYKFFIRAIDRSGNQSFLASAAQITIAGPDTPTATFDIVGDQVVFNWNEVTSKFAVKEYHVSVGSTFGTSTELVATKSTSYSIKANWSGDEQFWFWARDIAGNDGTPFQLTVHIAPPGSVANLTYQILDNFVNLRWDAPMAGSLPVDHYKIYAGTTFGSATLLGEEKGTFHSEFETVAGTIRFWIVAEDSAENPGVEVFTDVPFTAPRDFVLFGDVTLTAFTTYSNVIKDTDGSFVGPIDTSATWATHFSGNSWTDIADQIAAGLPIYGQPGTMTGYCETVIDFGASIPSATISAFSDFVSLAGSCALTPTISWSPDNSTYHTASGSAVVGTTFRYVKIRYTFSGATSAAIGVLRNPRITLTVRTGTDSGSVTVTASGSGTHVNYNVSFLSITAMSFGVQGSGKLFAEYVVDAGADPAGFTLYLWKQSDGSAAAGTVGWNANGVLG